MSWPFRQKDNRPSWDRVQADRLKGATVLVGLTFNNPAGPCQEQFFGTVMDATETEGITLRLKGNRMGALYMLPPDLRALHPARPGSYPLRETGEVVIDPDYTTTWDVTSPRR